jgi:hypothetical protein
MVEYKLPDVIELTDFGGNFASYNDAVYRIFKNDFVVNKPQFQGTRLGLKRYPLIDDKEYTYYHFTHDGDVETERVPNLRRMERIAWPSPMINNSEISKFKVWKNIRRGNGGTKTRILIFCEDENYLVVLDDRGDFILPWTAYLVHDSKKNRLLAEYEQYIKAETAKKT